MKMTSAALPVTPTTALIMRFIKILGSVMPRKLGSSYVELDGALPGVPPGGTPGVPPGPTPGVPPGSVGGESANVMCVGIIKIVRTIRPNVIKILFIVFILIAAGIFSSRFFLCDLKYDAARWMFLCCRAIWRSVLFCFCRK